LHYSKSKEDAMKTKTKTNIIHPLLLLEIFTT
jgi:hypothetical protein